MGRLILSALFIIITGSVFSQSTNSGTKVKWDKGGTFTLALAQGGTRNWAPGGDRFSLALNGFLTIYANRTKNRWHFDNILEANFGLVNTTTAGVIKNDDKLDINSKLSYQFGKGEVKHWRGGGLMNFRTQFGDGYDYDKAVKKRISAFFAPGIFVLSPGVQYYSKDKSFNVHFSPYTGRWVIVASRPYELAANYNVDAAQEVKIEAGAFVSATFNKEVIKNVQYRTRLDLFSNYLADDPSNLDFFWTNMFRMKINKYLGVIYNFDLQYDDDTQIFGYSKDKPGTQLKSILGVGLSVTF